MPGEIDMSCKSFGLLCGLVSLVLVLVGLPALLVRLQTAQVICPCQDNADLFSASVTSDTMLQAVVLANPAPLHFDAVVLSSYKVLFVLFFFFLLCLLSRTGEKGMIEINASVSVVFMSDPCPVAASLVVGSRYVLAGTYFPKDGVLEISSASVFFFFLLCVFSNNVQVGAATRRGGKTWRPRGS
jgi:hypothetical protein